jgi:hypothetical protein
MNRMNREQFFAQLAPLDEQQLKKALWNVYWRGAAAVRERIEAELESGQSAHRDRIPAVSVDPARVLDDAREFVSLARSGAYMAGDRRVSPRERTQWRSTFKRLIKEARGALRDEDVTSGAAAMETLIDLACETGSYDYFHSEDPMEAARIVVSDEVALLWGRLVEVFGFRAFAEQAAPQLIRWETRFGWTRSGWGKISEREVSLATVLDRMLQAPYALTTFADCYLEALDRVAAGTTATPRARSWSSGDSGEYERSQRTDSLAEWNQLLIDRLPGDEAHDRLDRLAAHPALGGPERTFLAAKVAYRRGDEDRARSLVHECLTQLPGHHAFLAFAAEIDAPLPPAAEKIAKERAKAQALIDSAE